MENTSSNTPLRHLNGKTNDFQAQLVSDLASIWHDFVVDLESTPIISKILDESITIDEYLNLLKDLRQQVIQGVNWISRIGSSMDPRSSPIIEALRNEIVQHAGEENNDYKQIERDFVALGGDVQEIRSAKMNIGSMALDAFIMYEASRPNPVQMIGIIYIIEGLGAIKATQWGTKVSTALGSEKGVSFLTYHGAHDEDHQGIVERLVMSPLMTPELADEMKRIAKVCGMLYANQFRNLGRY